MSQSQPLGGTNDNAYDHEPGARPVWFGKHEGLRFDQLELSYRLALLRYCEERPAPNLVRFRDHNKKYEDWLKQQRDEEPGATVMWFGIHKGTRLDKLDEGYRRSIVHLSHWSQEPTWAKFRELNEKYMDWLDERRSPMSTVVWFGKYQGHELRVLYRAARRWKWLLRNCGKWHSDLKDIERRYAIWKSKQPPRHSSRPRARYKIVNPRGECLGPQDDGVTSDVSDTYDTDDGFVVPDDDDELSGEEASDDGDLGYDPDTLREDIEYDDNSVIGLEHLFDDLADESSARSQRTQLLTPAREFNGVNDQDSNDDLSFLGERKATGEFYACSSSDSDSSLPSLNELFRRRAASKARSPRKVSPRKTPSEASPSKRRLVPRSQLKQSSRTLFTSVEQRTAPETPLFSRKRRRSIADISDSSVDSDTPLIPLLKRRMLNRNESSVHEEDSSGDEPFVSPFKSRR